jgi:hypothetical protein
MFSIFKSLYRPISTVRRFYSSTYECHKKPGRLYVYVTRNNDFFRFQFEDYNKYCARVESDGYRFVYIYDFDTPEDRKDFIHRFYNWHRDK